MQLEYEQYEIAKDVYMMKMQQYSKSGMRCSLSLEEYSSLNHRRYLNMIVHQDKD